MAVRVPQLRADPRDQLVERERLGEVVVRTELEPAQLRREIGARGEDHDGQLGPALSQLSQHRQPVDAREQEVEDDEVVRCAACPVDCLGAVSRPVDSESFRLETSHEERKDTRLILHDQDPHACGPTIPRLTRK